MNLPRNIRSNCNHWHLRDLLPARNFDIRNRVSRIPQPPAPDTADTRSWHTRKREHDPKRQPPRSSPRTWTDAFRCASPINTDGRWHREPSTFRKSAGRAIPGLKKTGTF
ncbi:MAG: hypothetical protein NTV84_09430 [Methanoregula sp.]|nr:hypothetical protein [Methanoregula sp.]